MKSFLLPLPSQRTTNNPRSLLTVTATQQHCLGVPDSPPLPSNRHIALQRTRSTLRCLRQRPDLLDHYNDIITDQLRRGFIEKVPADTLPADRVHYLPHHHVEKASSTTPIRIVYDCSCRASRNGVSLNDCLHPGPPLVADLTTILTRFRLKRYALTADIEKAFPQIGLAPQDRDVTRFFWHDPDAQDLDGLMNIYRFKVLLFGATSSPFILHATVRKHLASADSDTARLLQDSLYVDNAVTGVDTVEDASRFCREATALMLNGGFRLRSWACNDSELQSVFTTDGVADSNTTVPVLGLQWNVAANTLQFTQHAVIPAQSPVTKRTALQIVSRVYDPLGLMSPVTISAKIFLQDLWKQNIGWDDWLPDDLQQR